MRMKSRWVVCGLAGLAAVLLNSCTTSNGVVGATGTGFMWVTTQGDQLLTSYSINLTTGAASQVGTSVPTGLGPVAIALTPAGDAMFVANRNDNTIGAYKVNSDGSLALPCSTANCNTVPAAPVAGTPVAMTIDPSGKFLFVANLADQLLFPPPNTPDTVSVFSISGAALTTVGAFTSTGNGPAALAASPTGNFLYVANRYTSTVSILSYDNTGTLTQPLGPPITVGTNPVGLAFSRCTGTTTATTNCPAVAPPGYLFVANSGSNNVSVFSACTQVTTACPVANGTLTPIIGSPIASSGTGPTSFVVDPALDFVYLVNSGSFQVSEYKYSSATGFLAPLSPPIISTGASPLTSGITADGHWVYIPNSGGSSVSGFNLNPTTQTTPTGQLMTGPSVALVGQPSAVLVR